MPPKGRGGNQQQGRGDGGRGGGRAGGRGGGGGGGRSGGGGGGRVYASGGGGGRGGYGGRGNQQRQPPASAQQQRPAPPPAAPAPPPVPARGHTREEQKAEELAEELEGKMSIDQKKTTEEKQTMEKKSEIVVPVVAANYPPRPGYGSKGAPVTLYANHFLVDVKMKDDVYHYDVAMAEEGGRAVGRDGVPPKSLAEKIMRALLAAIKAKYPRETVVSDMRKNMYSPRRLPFEEELFGGLDIGERKGEEQTPRLFQAVVKQADPAAVRMDQLSQLWQGRLNYTPYDVLQALDIAMRHAASLRLTAFGRNLYSPGSAHYIGEGVDCWSGYFQSVRPTQNCLVINVDLAATAFVSAMSVNDFIHENLREQNQLVSLAHWQLSQASKALRGVKVETTHRPGVKRAYRVNGLSPRSAAETMFEDDNGRSVSVADYFAKNYQRLRFPKLPCVHVGAQNKKMYFPIEVCNIIAGQKCPRKLTDMQTSEMIKVAKTSPQDRKSRIEKIVKDANFSQDPFMKAFGLTVNPSMVTAQGRSIPPPQIQYGGGSPVRPIPGSWKAPNAPFVSTGTRLESFGIISFDRNDSSAAVRTFFQKMLGTMGRLRMTSTTNMPAIIRSTGRGVSIRDLFDKAMGAAQSCYGKRAQLIWVLMPRQDAITYGQVKQVSDTQVGIPSQCMLLKHIMRPNDMYIGNVLLKVNVKLQGQNWKLASPLPLKIAQKRTIVIGADVTHPSPGDNSRPSIAAVVGSLNSDFTAHASSVRTQDRRQEIIGQLNEMVKDVLRAYYAANKPHKPDNIIFYRDGVSEGQFQQVLNAEITAIRNGCNELQAGYHPAITFIVVQKRHHTRFFARPGEGDRSGNVQAGTVVDNGVCHPTEYDFYLMSHAGIQGTSRPTHYHVLLDEIQLSPDELQTFTYHLCYTYARCTRSVSMVPSAYYSHLLAFRARHFLPDGSDSASSTGSISSTPSTTNLQIFMPVPQFRSVQYYM